MTYLAATSFTQSLTTISLFLGLLGIFSGVFSFSRYGNYKTTVNLQNDNIKALTDTTLRLEKELIASKLERENQGKAIAHLEGKVATYKEIPLEKIATSMEALAKSNNEILATLKSSALIRAAEVSDTLNDNHVVEDNTKAVQDNTVSVDKNTKGG